MQTRQSNGIMKKTNWLVVELMAIVNEQDAEILDARWFELLDQPSEAWMETDFYKKLVFSIRILLNNASITTLEDFQAMLVKLRFGEVEVVAREAYSLKAWLSPGFMSRMESDWGREGVDELLELQEEKEVGQDYVGLVRKYFDLKEVGSSEIGMMDAHRDT
jgi:hypothetical protein